MSAPAKSSSTAAKAPAAPAGRDRAPPAAAAKAPSVQTAGNQQVLNALGLRASLAVSRPADPEERAAERSANAFVAGQSLPMGFARAASPDARRSGRGEPLAPGVRRDYEGFFGADLSNVRIHTDAASDDAARALSADAFAYGSDLHFRSGRFDPHGASGRRLLAHELSHTRQSGAPVLRRQEAAAMSSEGPVSSQAPVSSEAPQENLDIRFDLLRPWLFTVPEAADDAKVSRELYGVDLSQLMSYEIAESQWWESEGPARKRFMVFPDALTPAYSGRFRASMDVLLEQHVKTIKGKLSESRIDAGDEAELISYVRFWAEAKDLRQPGGRSYFDALLARLQTDRAAFDYWLWSGESRPYLDWLYEEVEERKGELLGLIAQGSREFGAYRPAWGAVDVTGAAVEPGTAPLSGSENIVMRAEALIIDGLEGSTSTEDSRIVADTLSGLPAPEQAEVLKRIMRRYDETDWTGLFGRFGEAWEGGMLYYLFEDLTEEDRQRAAAALRASGVMPPETVDALVAGRGWGGKYLPFTTRKGQEAAEYWAERYEKTSGAEAADAYAGGLFASLWLPETAGTTVITLATAGAMTPQTGAFAVLGNVAPRFAAGVGIVGAGLGGYGVGIAAQEAITGRNVWTDQRLQDGERLAAVLNAVSGTILFGVGLSQIPRGLAVRDVFLPPPKPISWRVTSFDEATGDAVVVGLDPSSGQQGIVRINLRTGNGTAVNTSTGETWTLVGGRLQNLPVLEAGTGAAGAAGGVTADETSLALSQAISRVGAAPMSGQPIPFVSPALQPGVWYPLSAAPPASVPKPQGIFDIITDTRVPLAVRIRIKAALDEGRISWQVDAFGNAKVRVAGSARFPGDMEIRTALEAPATVKTLPPGETAPATVPTAAAPPKPAEKPLATTEKPVEPAKKVVEKPVEPAPAKSTKPKAPDEKEIAALRKEEAVLKERLEEELRTYEQQEQRLRDLESAQEELDFYRKENPNAKPDDQKLIDLKREANEAKRDLANAQRNFKHTSDKVADIRQRLAEIDAAKKLYYGDKPWRQVSLKDPADPNINNRKGFVGELYTSDALATAKFEPLGGTARPAAVKTIDDFEAGLAARQGKQDIDGIFKRPQPGHTEYWVTDSKASGDVKGEPTGTTGDLKTMTTGAGERQLSDEWIHRHLDSQGLSPQDLAKVSAGLKQLGQVVEVPVEGGGVERVLVRKVYAQTDADGTTFYEVTNVSRTEVTIGKKLDPFK